MIHHLNLPRFGEHDDAFVVIEPGSVPGVHISVFLSICFPGSCRGAGWEGTPHRLPGSSDSFSCFLSLKVLQTREMWKPGTGTDGAPWAGSPTTSRSSSGPMSCWWPGSRGEQENLDKQR